MKRILKITSFIIFTTVLLSSGIISKNISSGINLNSAVAIRDDTTSLIHMIDVDSFRLEILPPSSGVQFYKDGIVFLSLSKYENKMSPNHISFGVVEAYYASVEDSVLGKHMIFSPSSSFSYPCEAMTFSRDYNTVYFTKLSKKDRKEKIFMAKFGSDSKNQTNLFPEIIPLDFCADDYAFSHPTLSSDGTMMIFASDIKGSFGGMDLFVSRLADGKWSVPENLGKFINSAGNEFFPFLDSENNLFFSSDGLPGYGGYDIFTCKFNGVDWDKPINLSDRINSDMDDIAFTINKTDGKSGFFTRRQKSGKRDMQLFRVTLNHEVADQNLLTLSNVFYGNPVPKTNLIAATSNMEVKSPEAEPQTIKPGIDVVKTEEVKVPETITEIKKTAEKITVIKPEPTIDSAENKAIIIKEPKVIATEQKDVVIYRVQLLPSATQINSKEMVINGTSYKLYEYLYRGAYRYAIGEFSTLVHATTLQRICRQSGYPQSFVVAFKNNIRSLDVNLFK
ncbi:MAG: hypothetical protein ABR927_19190 [Bacteroidales bacterium]|jgi:hypothetical protein